MIYNICCACSLVQCCKTRQSSWGSGYLLGIYWVLQDQAPTGLEAHLHHTLIIWTGFNRAVRDREMLIHMIRTTAC